MSRWWMLLLWLMPSWIVAQPLPPLLLTTHEMPPYSMREGLGATGLAARRVDCALQAMQQPFQLRLLPWKRAQHEVQLGRADGFFAGARNVERDGYAVASAVIAPQQWTWFQRAGATVHPDDPDFRFRAIVASFLGAAMYDHLKQQGYPGLMQARDMDQLIDWLLTGKVDAVMAADLVMAYHLQRRGVGSNLIATPYRDKPLVVYFSKTLVAANPGFLPRFNEAVANCIADEADQSGGPELQL
ncbi:MAG: hypothetical protein II007_07570 [Gammaproteobacteria bacterium]|nr:hypothetical protein [Gammaproteobacteria bacterium]